MAKNEPSTVQLAFTMEQGLPGCDDDPKNPISLALCSLMRDSAQLPGYVQAFLIDDEGDQTWRWLGVFVKSAGGRILFFPGVKDSIQRLRAARGEVHQFDRPFKLDHISLEADRRSWHLTTARSKDHQGGPLTADLGGGRVLWFGMSLAGAVVMRELREQTLATFDVPDRSAEWKIKQFEQARDSRLFPALQLPPRPDAESGPIFPHIAVIVGPTGFEDYTGPNWAWPYGSEYVQGRPNGHWRISVRTQRFQLDDKTDIQLTSIWAPGTLTIPVVLSATPDC